MPRACAQYKLFVIDYNDSQAKTPRSSWGPAAEKNFAEAVRNGTGVAAIHGSNNAFIGWTEYEQMMGLVWIKDTTGHGKYHEFKVEYTDHDSPITKGLADFTTSDELYHKLVNSQKVKFNLLAQAFDAKDIGGSEQNEPMQLTLQFGKARVATPLGHVWGGPDDPHSSVLNPGFKTLLVRGAEWAATGAVTLPAEWKDVEVHNKLSGAESAAGWKSLFDGKNVPADFKGYKQAKFPEKGWSVTDGMLHNAAGAGGGDLCTVGEYGDFEFACDWRVAPGGNSGIIYRVTEDHNYSWETGREMQILDDAKHNDGKKPKTRAGTMYDLFACAQEVCRPAGEWNHARVVCKGTHIEHWLNGIKVVDVDTAGEDYKKAMAESKFTTMPEFGTKMKGHICLQDHGDEVWFRDIRVREIK